MSSFVLTVSFLVLLTSTEMDFARKWKVLESPGENAGVAHACCYCHTPSCAIGSVDLSKLIARSLDI